MSNKTIHLALVGMGLPLITAEHIVIRLDDDTTYDIQKAAEKAMDAIFKEWFSATYAIYLIADGDEENYAEWIYATEMEIEHLYLLPGYLATFQMMLKKRRRA